MSRSVPSAAHFALPEPRVAQLSLGEQLVLWAFRKRLEGEERVATVQRGFDLASPGRSEHDAFAAFEELFCLIARHCGRDLWFHHCACGCISCDEMAILGLVAAEQAGDIASAGCYAQALVTDPAVSDLLCAAEALGRALAERRLALPLRDRHTSWGPEGAGTRPH